LKEVLLSETDHIGALLELARDTDVDATTHMVPTVLLSSLRRRLGNRDAVVLRERGEEPLVIMHPLALLDLMDRLMASEGSIEELMHRAERIEDRPPLD
jgi:hypothetical protein